MGEGPRAIAVDGRRVFEGEVTAGKLVVGDARAGERVAERSEARGQTTETPERGFTPPGPLVRVRVRVRGTVRVGGRVRVGTQVRVRARVQVRVRVRVMVWMTVRVRVRVSAAMRVRISVRVRVW